MKKKNISAFILAGGMSSRMGQEKGLVKLHGKSFIEHIIQSVKAIDLPVNIITNSDFYNYLNYPVYPDIFKNKGPIGGIHSALKNSITEYNLILSCDIPFVTEELIECLVSKTPTTHDCVIPVCNENEEPLCGIYKTRILDTISDVIKTESLGVKKLLKQLNVHYTDISEQSFYSNNLLRNINTSAQLEDVQSLIKTEFNA